METRYITIPAGDRKARKKRERLREVWGLAHAAVGLVCLVGITAIVVRAVYEPVPVSVDAAVSAEVYTAPEADLWAEESQGRGNPSPLTDSEWATLLEVCEARSIDVSLALGLIWVESRFDPNAVSKSGCYGYCQINPRWHPDGLSPEENIRYGLNYLADQCERYDSVEAGLTAYNAGRDTGNRRYANAVLAAAKEWEVKGNDPDQ